MSKDRRKIRLFSFDRRSFSLYEKRLYYDIRIFVTCSPDEQARRLRKREGKRYSNFVERWIPLEEGYFANYSIEENAEMMVVTD